MKQNALALMLTLLVAAVLAAVLWWDYVRTAPPSESARSAPAAESSSRTEEGLRLERAPRISTAQPAVAPEAPPPSSGTYRCEQGGRITYQASPCAVGTTQKAVTGGTFNVVRPPPVPAIVARPEPERLKSSIGHIGNEASRGAGNEARCNELERAIARVDATARRGGSAQWQERLREQRRAYQDRMWALKCGF